MNKGVSRSRERASEVLQPPSCRSVPRVSGLLNRGLLSSRRPWSIKQSYQESFKNGLGRNTSFSESRDTMLFTLHSNPSLQEPFIGADSSIQHISVLTFNAIKRFRAVDTVEGHQLR